jgi:hypothetical protein
MRPILKLFWRLLILGGPLAAALGLFIFSLPGPNYDNYYAAILDKERMLREIPAPRILLVGGSNLTFGIDSELISKTYNRPVINMSLHAAIGLKLMLAQVRANLQPGDTVILVPEYEQFCAKTFEGETTNLANILEIDHSELFLLDASQLWRLPDIAKLLIRYRYQGLANPKQFQSEFYARANYNSLGDTIRHLDAPPVRPVLGGKYIWAYELMKNPAVIPALNEFQRYAAGKGVSVLLLFPNSMASTYDLSAEDIQKLADDVRAHVQFPVLGTPQDFRLDDQYFFDTTYHLTRAGRDIRTKKFIELLQASGALR